MSSGSRRSRDRGGVKDVCRNVIITVDGRQLSARADILMRHSSVFAEMIEEEERTRHLEETLTDIAHAERYLRGLQKNASSQELVITKFGYKDVKLLVSILNSTQYKTELSAEKALKILPLVKEYNLSKLRRSCQKVLLDEIESTVDGKGSLNTDVLLTYLAAADHNDLQELRKVCILEYAMFTDASSRQKMVKDKHILEKSKVSILEKVCEKQDAEYLRKISSFEKDIQNRCADLQRRRDEIIDETKVWREELQKEFDEIAEGVRKTHDSNAVARETNRGLETVKKTFDHSFSGLLSEMGKMQTTLDQVLEALVTDDDEEKEKVRQLIEKLENLEKTFTNKVNGLGSRLSKEITEKMYACTLRELELPLSENYELYDKLDQFGAEIEVKSMALADVEVKLDQEKLQHSKTKAELEKWTEKVHKINTWVKWAKPPSDEESTCACFRHSSPRK